MYALANRLWLSSFKEKVMRELHQSELDKIVLVSKILLPLFYLTLATCVVAVGYYVLLLMTSPTSGADSVIFEGVSSLSQIKADADDIEAGLLTASDKLTIGALFLLFFSVFTSGLIVLIKLLNRFKSGRVFSEKCVHLAKVFGYIFLAYVILSTTMNVAFTLVSGNLELNFLFFSKDYVILGLIWLFVWILDIGSALNADDELTI